MANVICPRCSTAFNPNHHIAKAGALAAGAAGGAWLGSSIGIVAGPIGGTAGTIPGALIGGALAFLGISKFAKCPNCAKVFKI